MAKKRNKMLRKKIMKKNFGEFVLAVIGVTVIALLTLYVHAQAIVETNKEVGSPSYGQWVTTSTPIWLNATAANGLNATYYRIWNGTWHPSSDKDYYCGNHNITSFEGPYVPYTRYQGYWYIYRSYDSRNRVNFGPIHFHEECMHMIQYFSVDNLSYFEEIQNQTHYVDDTPPLVTKEYGEPYYEKTVLLLENFEWSFPPEGWSADAGWSKSDSAHAGGTPPEAHFHSPWWDSYKLRLPVLNTVGYEQLNFSFSYAATFSFNNWLSVWVSPDGSTWYQPWHRDGFSYTPATDVTVTLDSSHGVGSSTFYIEFRASAQAFAGNIFIDDVTVTGTPSKHFITKDTPIYINASDIGNITKLSPGVPMVWPFWEILDPGQVQARIHNFALNDVTIMNLSYINLTYSIGLSDLTWDYMETIPGWTYLTSTITLSSGSTYNRPIDINSGDAAVLVRYNISIDGNVVARFIGEVLVQWDGSPAIIGTLTNFDVHNNFSMANNFELEINGIQPENITEFYPGWGTPPNITSWQTWTNITWINTTDPIYYCEWTHFGLGLDEGIDINDISEMIANWTVSCAVGSYVIYYKVWGGMDEVNTGWLQGEENHSVVFTLADLGITDNCTHYIAYYAIDDLGNNYTEPIVQTVYVDNAEPIIDKTIGHPQYLDDGDIFINFSTPIWVNATDNGTEPCIVGSVNLTVGIYNATSRVEINRYTIYVEDGWAHIGPIYINEECVHWINITAVDDLGNTAYHNETVYVDNTPPEIYKKIIGTNATGGGFKWITSETEFNLSAIDAGCNEGVGLASLQYRIWNGTWTPWMDYAGNFTMDEECIHYVEINATDLVGNSNISNQTYHVDNSPPLSFVNSIHPFCQDLPVLITATAIDLPYCGEVKNVTLYYRYSVHNSSWSPWMKYYTDESSPWAWGFNPTNGSGYYQFYCIATDMLGHVESKSPTAEAWLSVPYNHTFHLIKGWNLITIPVKNHITKASELAALIGNNCTVIVKWDSEKQKYVDYVLGIPPSTNNIDFDIENGMAYFIGMKGNENVSIKGCLFDSLNVLLHSQGYGLNLIGWVNMTETDSPSIASVAEIDSLWDWNESMQQFIGFPVDIFNVAIGDGIFIHVTSEASWHGGL